MSFGIHLLLDFHLERGAWYGIGESQGLTACCRTASTAAVYELVQIWQTTGNRGTAKQWGLKHPQGVTPARLLEKFGQPV